MRNVQNVNDDGAVMTGCNFLFVCVASSRPNCCLVNTILHIHPGNVDIESLLFIPPKNLFPGRGFTLEFKVQILFVFHHTEPLLLASVVQSRDGCTSSRSTEHFIPVWRNVAVNQLRTTCEPGEKKPTLLCLLTRTFAYNVSGPN